MELSNLDTLLIVLSIAVGVVVLCKYLRIPPILGYIGVGVIVGPHFMGWISARAHITPIAEFGIVFLMFTIGLEFSLMRMLRMRRLVFGLGGAQVALTVIVTALVGHWLSLDWEQAIVLGCIVSLSSTAIVLKQLTDQNEIGSRHGHNAISILLFQDLAVIPFFILISSFTNNEMTLTTALLFALGKTVIVMLLIFGLGYWLLRPLFRGIATTNSLELFTLSVLLVTVSAAWLSHRLGLSLALGAFMAGMMLGETEFRHQIEATIRPFRDLLLGLFFITIGMLFNIAQVANIWHWVLILFVALTGLKIVIITFVCYVSDKKIKRSLRTGLILAQGSEFGFALLALTIQDKILPQLYGQVVLGALLFSMSFAPILIYFNKQIASFIIPKRWQAKAIVHDQTTTPFVKDLKDHVIICGFGRNGQNIAKILDDENVPYIGIDSDHQLAHSCEVIGYPVIYGDASLYEILESCKIADAKALVITCEPLSVIEKILQQVRSHHKQLPIYVRTADDMHFEQLQAMGATEIIPASLETGLTLASHLLITMGVPSKRILELIIRIRKTRYRMLRDVLSSE